MTDNKTYQEIKFKNAKIEEQSEKNSIRSHNMSLKTKSKKDKKIQNLKKLNSFLEHIKNENLESQENKNDIKDNHSRHLNTEVQELNTKKIIKSLEKKGIKTNKLAPVDNNLKTDLMKIDDLEHFSRLLKKKIENQNKTKCFKIKKFFERILDNNIYIIFMMLVTILILFISDIQSGWLDKTVDNSIEIMQTIIFCLYTLEIIITTICKDGYINSFFFWLDILSTVYIIQDINFIINPILGLNINYLLNLKLIFNPKRNIIEQNEEIDNDLGDNIKVIQGVKTAFSKLTAASRATRILRLIKIVRLIRMVKLYKAAILAKKNFEMHKSKKKISKKYSRIPYQANNVSNLKVNQSFDFIKLTPNENVSITKNNKPTNLDLYGISKRDNIMNMNNVQIIEFENNYNNINCGLGSPKIYKIINGNKNSIESLDKYDNDKNTYLQTDANIRESSKEIESKILENKIEMNKRREKTLLNGKKNEIDLSLNYDDRSNYQITTNVNLIVNSQSEKCLDKYGKHNLCLLDAFRYNNNKYNNNNISTEKTPRSNREFLNSDLQNINEKIGFKDEIIKLKECEQYNLEKNLKNSIRYSNSNSNNYNIKIIFAESKNYSSEKNVRNYTVRENNNSDIKDLYIGNKLNNPVDIFFKHSNDASSNSNIEENKNNNSEIINKNKALSNKNIIKINYEDNINNFSNNNNKSHDHDYVKIPIDKHKLKILYNSKQSNKVITLKSRDSLKNNAILSKMIKSENNNVNDVNRINKDKITEKSPKQYYKETNFNKRESEIELLKNNHNHNHNNLEVLNSVVIKRNPEVKRDVQIDNLLSESKTRILLTESITKKVILLILSLVIFLPILSEEFYRPSSIDNYTILANYISNYKSIMPEKYDKIIPQFIIKEEDINYPIINITDTNGLTIYRNETLSNFNYRYSEIESAISPEGDIIILFSVLDENKFAALLSIIKTIFVCLCLLVATIYFEKDTKNLVLDPLEIMIEIVEMVSKDPIKAKDLDNFNMGAKSIYLQMQFFDEKKLKKYEKQKEKSEVKVIQSAIKKIAALLAIGLGEAGSEIIKENLSNYNDLDPMIKGRKKIAIFGFCDIRDFPIINEALQENTVVFLNQIADIVHSSVDLFFGSTNKNIGDAFLTVWNVPTKNNLKRNESNKSINDINKNNYGSDNNVIQNLNGINNNIERKFSRKIDMANKSINNNTSKITKAEKKNARKLNKKVLFENNKQINAGNIDIIDKHNIINLENESQKDQKNNSHVVNNKIKIEMTNTADCSVLAFLTIIIKINRDLRILAYRSNLEIKKHILDYKVTMGFGLHTGWAIEGAIGSNYKIDASYLSPNVNMAARLEAATRQYGVKILISGQIFELLSEKLKIYCRIIDIVTVKGSLEPIKLYTFDLNEEAFKPYSRERKDFSDKRKREKQIQIKNVMKASLEELNLTEQILNKKQFKRLLNDARPIEFYVAFNNAFKHYVDGDWKRAKSFFLKCMLIYENDGPVNTLYEFIKSFEFVSPKDWRGYRSLTSK